MKTTVLGGHGFIGSALVTGLRESGTECWAPARDDGAIFERDLGLVFYCVGITADFRSRPLDTVEAHVSLLQRVMSRARFDRLIYLSSTRVYKRTTIAEEDRKIEVLPSDPDDLYDLSKLMGESLVLSAGKTCSAVRLSNVVGPGMGDTNFLGAVVAEARKDRKVLIRSSSSSAKDYIWIDDVVAGLRAVAEHGRNTIYNLASGANCTNAQIASILTDAGIEVKVNEEAPVVTFPRISITKLAQETGFRPRSVLPLLSKWIDAEIRN
ncbi:MAG: NAD-dependent dehydratase [Alphaproteobacteria bacterium HGW-Alphaproteobacteria-12]|nr:MAG: NAD-dependent dehydratase [Alphaproteobacteria bacterium HGW-Alphaproteobacteria-12]